MEKIKEIYENIIRIKYNMKNETTTSPPTNVNDMLKDAAASLRQRATRSCGCMLGCLIDTPPQPRLLIRSWAPRSSGVLDQTPPGPLPCPVQTSTLSALSDAQTAEVWDPLPDPPISSQRNSSNEALWGTDAERAARAKTTCHSHLMITHMVMSQRLSRRRVCVCLYTCECACAIEYMSLCESSYCATQPTRIVNSSEM